MNGIKQSGLVGLFVLLSSFFGAMQAMNNNMNNNINNNMNNNMNSNQQPQQNLNNFLVMHGYLNGTQPLWPAEFIDNKVETTETFTELGLPPLSLNISPEVTLQIDDQGNETWTESGPSQQVESNLEGRGSQHFLKLNLAEIGYKHKITTTTIVTKFFPANQQGPNNNYSQQNQG